MLDYLRPALAEEPRLDRRTSVQRSQVRLESARIVLARAARQLARADAALRANMVALPGPVLPVIDAPVFAEDGEHAHWDRLRACVRRLTVL